MNTSTRKHILLLQYPLFVLLPCLLYTRPDLRFVAQKWAVPYPQSNQLWNFLSLSTSNSETKTKNTHIICPLLDTMTLTLLLPNKLAVPCYLQFIKPADHLAKTQKSGSRWSGLPISQKSGSNDSYPTSSQ